MKELRTLFDTPPAFGRDVQLGRRCAYSVHDCAGVLKRYLMELPQPVIPWELYSTFREVELLAESNGASALTKPSAAKALAEFIRDLPSMNRDLLLFLTGTLAVFSSYSCSTLMCVDNLAAVFQPGLLNHPKHARDPAEYARNQRVVAALVRHNLTLFADPGLEKLPPAGAQGRGPTCSRETASLIPPDVAAGVPRPPRQRDRPLPRNSAGPQQYRDWPAGAPPPPPPPAEPDPSGEVPAGDQPSSPAQPRNPSAARAPRSRQPPPPPLLTTLAPAPHRGPPMYPAAQPRAQEPEGLARLPEVDAGRGGPSGELRRGAGARLVLPAAFADRLVLPAAFADRRGARRRRRAARALARSSTVAPSVPRRSATISVMPPPPDDPDAKQREAVSRAARPDAREPAARRDGRERRSAAEEAAAAPRRPDVSHPR
ncbi:MAG: Rho GTPase activation protein [Olpidium bornovanus]|uniref:Rho GTPase activation protein n=1 Tax=Olpidium bornovanus TaxID=278681 RepID=A0A8H8DG86_9FUNG|nr:MAG: Rho GTPase activation protein [Olpidium bornovanus]